MPSGGPIPRLTLRHRNTSACNATCGESTGLSHAMVRPCFHLRRRRSRWALGQALLPVATTRTCSGRAMNDTPVNQGTAADEPQLDPSSEVLTRPAVRRDAIRSLGTASMALLAALGLANAAEAKNGNNGGGKNNGKQKNKGDNHNNDNNSSAGEQKKKKKKSGAQ